MVGYLQLIPKTIGSSPPLACDWRAICRAYLGRSLSEATSRALGLKDGLQPEAIWRQPSLTAWHKEMSARGSSAHR